MFAGSDWRCAVDILAGYGTPYRLPAGPPGQENCVMSMHRSLKSASKIATRRNVLKRFERVDMLKQDGKWNQGDRAYGLPKTKPQE